jgi:hypothetical protein
MAAILISNLTSLWAEIEDPAFHLPDAVAAFEIFAQQIPWGGNPEDIIIPPTRPSTESLQHVADPLGFKSESLTLFASNSEGSDTGLNSSPSDSYSDFLEDFRIKIKEKGVDRGYPYYFDLATANLMQQLRLHETTPGFDFCSQAGTDFLNSKVNFRAVALGTGLPVPEGSVADTSDSSSRHVWRQLDSGRQAIAKQEFNTGGPGNAILSSREIESPLGVARKAVLSTYGQVVNYISDHWMHYSNSGRSRVSVERYMESSSPIYAEFTVGEDGAHLLHCGEIRMNPIYHGVEVPIRSHQGKHFPEFLKGSSRIAELVFSLGYRGYLSVDAISTANGGLLFNSDVRRLTPGACRRVESSETGV